MARGRNDPYSLNLGTTEEIWCNYVCESISILTDSFNANWRKKQFERAQDDTLATIKEMCNFAQNTWMNASGTCLGEPFTRATMIALSYNNDIPFKSGEDTYTTCTLREGTYYVYTYPLLVLRNVNRALSVGSEKAAQQAAEAVYWRFTKDRKVTDEAEKNSLKKFIRNYYACLEDAEEGATVSHRLTNSIGTSACFERPRSKGGVLGLVSEPYNIAPHQPYIGEALNTQIQNNSVYSYNFCLDTCEPFLDHAAVCVGIACDKPHLHLPLTPIVIKESGGRMRVPCITSGVANYLGDHIRNKLFYPIKRDNRTSFRYTKRKDGLQKFLNAMGSHEKYHSSDLKSSTDFFPFEFCKTVADELLQMKKITLTEWKTILMLTQSMRMIPPGKETSDLRLARMVKTVKEIKEQDIILSSDVSSSFSPFVSKALNRQFQAIRDHYNDTGKAHRHTQMWGKLEGYREAVYHTDYEVVNSYKKDIQRCLMEYYPDEYLTQAGLHMSTSVSIAFLNLYNLYCDWRAEDISGHKAHSLLTGDDALRGSTEENIEAYKQTMIKWQSIFSPTKDFTTTQSRAVYTELLIENGIVKAIPKIKLLLRAQESRMEAPTWQTSISRMSQITAPMSMVPVIRNMMLTEFRNMWKPFSRLPIDEVLAVEHDVPYPEGKEYPWIFKRILSIEDPYLAMNYWNQYTILTRVQSEADQIGAPIPHIYASQIVYTNTGEWKPGSLWLGLALRKLGGLIRAAASLRRPSWHARFRKGKPSFLAREQERIEEEILWIPQMKYLDYPRNPSQFKRSVWRRDVDLSSIIPAQLLEDDDDILRSQ